MRLDVSQLDQKRMDSFALALRVELRHHNSKVDSLAH